MPANIVKTKGDEKAWNRAKARLGSRYGTSDRHWATLVKIFKAIKTKRS